MKKKLRVLCLGLLCALLMGNLLACKGDGGLSSPTNGGTAAETLPEAPTAEGGETGEGIPADAIKLAAYRITYPDDRTATYLAEWADRLAVGIQTKANEKPRSGTDWYREESDYDPKSLEILIGHTNRSESREALAALAPDEYCILRSGNKIVIQAPSLSGIDQAVSKLYDAIILAENYKGGLLELPKSSFGCFKMNWCGSAPAFEGGSYAGSVEGNRGGYQLVYNGTTAEQFAAYTAKLKSNGYTEVQTNRAGENLTGSYANQAAGLRVFVTFTAYNQITSVAVEKYAEYSLVNGTRGELPVQIIAGSCNDRIYFIRLSDGRIIVIDGDNVNGTQTEAFMRDLTFINGSAENIRIAAWIISHPHGDHYKMIESVGKTYGASLQVEQVLYNVPAATMNRLSPENAAASESLLRSFADRFASKPQIIFPHTGQIFNYAGTLFEILYTHEDIYPAMFANANQTSMIIRMTEGSESVIWTHDMEDNASVYMIRKYRELLKCDAVMVGHHGWNGGGILEFYQRCAPTVLIWNNTKENWEYAVKHDGVGTKPIYELESVTRHLWCMSTDGQEILTFPIHHAE